MTYSDCAEDFEGSIASGDEDDIELPVVEPLAPVVPPIAVQRAGLQQLDHWDLNDVFSRQASVMRTVPRFLCGSFRIVSKVAMDEIVSGARKNEIQQASCCLPTHEEGKKSWARNKHVLILVRPRFPASSMTFFEDKEQGVVEQIIGIL